MIRASCRSDGRLDLGATLDACGAAVPAPRRPRRRGRLRDRGRALAGVRRDVRRPRRGAVPADPRLPLAIDLALPAPRRRLRPPARPGAGSQPCGVGNPEPLLLVLGLTVTRVRAATGGHTQLTLRRRLDVLDGIAFGRSDLAETVHEGDRGRRRRAARRAGRFGGYESLQLEIRDVASAGPRSAAMHRARRRRSADRRSAIAGRRRSPPRDRAGRGSLEPGRRRATRTASGRSSGYVAPGPGGGRPRRRSAIVTLSLMNGQLPFVQTGQRRDGNGGRRAARRSRPAPSNVVIVDPRSPSRARSSTPRPATSGSRPATDVQQLTTAGHGLDAGVLRRRPVDLLHPDRRGPRQVPRGRRRTAGPGTTSRRPRSCGSSPTAARAERLLTGRFQSGRLDLVRTGCASPSPTPGRQDGHRRLRTARTRSRATSSSSRSTSRREADVPEPAGVRLARAPGSRRGGRTARSSCTSRTGATGPRGAPQIYRYDPTTKKTGAAHRSGLPRPRRTRRTGGSSPRPGPTRSGRTS